MSNQKAREIDAQLTSKYGVTIPLAIRASLNLAPMDKVTFAETESGILIKKCRPSCKICGGEKELEKINGHYFCEKCLNAIKEAKAW